MPTPKKAASAKNALSKPVQPDAALAAVVGKRPTPPDRTDQKALGVHPQTRAPGSQGKAHPFSEKKKHGGFTRGRQKERMQP